MPSNSKAITKLQKSVWSFYKTHGRHDLPWRHTNDPYKILVSEIMLQQTQVSRVLPKYKTFIRKFPTIRTLAKAPLREVLALWSGLGYNRRAKFLHETAQIIVHKYNGKLPETQKGWEELPGIGVNTAAAISAYAYNQPVVFIETNIRTVFLYAFFQHSQLVLDATLAPIITQALPAHKAREWYWALMDYGSMLKRTIGNANQRSQYYSKQSSFRGSNRQLRGAIIKILLVGPQSITALVRETKEPRNRVTQILDTLKKDGLVRMVGALVHIA